MRAGPEARQNFLIPAVLSIAVIAMAAVLADSRRDIFKRLFGNYEPLLLISLFVIAGGVLLLALSRQRVFRIYSRKDGATGVISALLLSTLFAIAVIVAYLVWRLPEGINVALPHAWLFYPVMAYTAEMAFHVIPLAILVFAASFSFRRKLPEPLMWISIVAVALLEPAFQLGLAVKPLSTAGKYTGFHVLAINLCQLYLFKRYDFVSMLSFRLAY